MKPYKFYVRVEYPYSYRQEWTSFLHSKTYEPYETLEEAREDARQYKVHSNGDDATVVWVGSVEEVQ